MPHLDEPTDFPDLTHAREVIENLMVDKIVLRRDAAGVDDDTLDEGTGLLTSEATEIYRGKARIRTVRSTQSSKQEDRDAGARFDVKRREIDIPWDAASPAQGDEFEVLASRSDPSLVGTKLRIYGVIAQTHIIARKSYAEEATYAHDRLRIG